VSFTFGGDKYPLSAIPIYWSKDPGSKTEVGFSIGHGISNQFLRIEMADGKTINSRNYNYRQKLKVDNTYRFIVRCERVDSEHHGQLDTGGGRSCRVWVDGDEYQPAQTFNVYGNIVDPKSKENYIGHVRGWKKKGRVQYVRIQPYPLSEDVDDKLGFVGAVQGAPELEISVARLTKKNNSDGRDSSSALPLRTLQFTKQQVNSLMKLTYADNLRVIGNNKWCKWWIKVDGKDCPIPIYNAMHTANGYGTDNDHIPVAIAGTCANVKAGVHTMTIALTRSSGADCYTGWSASGARDAFFMEALEINPAAQITTVMRKQQNDDRDSGTLSGRSLKFEKRSDASQLRITWATNLRVRRNSNSRSGAECNWEIKIDGKSCPSPSKIGASLHTQNRDNDHIPVEIGMVHGHQKRIAYHDSSRVQDQLNV
jgi:hypothetical protein